MASLMTIRYSFYYASYPTAATLVPYQVTAVIDYNSSNFKFHLTVLFDSITRYKKE